ncbi:hypothetical protein Misp01_51030 [Microtetraspora sp. NBRC 13810]|nr:hypothetical protein Misp01_51030 [Microtetraspora sp. NBRC 13810]
MWSFALVVGLLTLTPGLDTAIILRTAALGHRRQVWGVVLGIQTGTLAWGTLTSLGITALLAASHLAYETLRLAGAAYLLWLGIHMLWTTWHKPATSPATTSPDAPPATTSPDAPPATTSPDALLSTASPEAHAAATSPEAHPAAASPGAAPQEYAAGAVPGVAGGFLAGWRRGTLTNLLNPKVGVFYVAVLPQFIPAGAPHLASGVLLTCVHILLGVLWSAALIGFARALRGMLRRPAARRLLDRVTGTVIAAFGLRLAFGD